MKASEVIKTLHAAIADYGDLECVTLTFTSPFLISRLPVQSVKAHIPPSSEETPLLIISSEE
jgi:hypothetical protein